MKTSYYFRSEILSYFDLSTDEQAQMLNDSNDIQHAEERSYVKGVNSKCLNVEILPLDMFMRTDAGLWHGVYGQTAFSAYFIRFNRSNDEALIAYRYN
jgi:hypothetical protein